MTQKSVDKLIEELNRKYKPEGSVVPVVARSDERPRQNFIPPTSPALGFVLGSGGWSEGHLHEFFGKEHAGKTTLMMLALKDCYEHYDGKRPIAFIDIEHRYNDEWARQLGLPTDLIVVQPTDAEQATDIMHSLIKPKSAEATGVCAIGFDSIGAAMSYKEHEFVGDREMLMAGAAKIMTRNVRTIAPLANLYQSTIFYSNQLRANMTGYGGPQTPGGYAVKHMMSCRIYLWPTSSNDTKKFDKIDGQEVQVGFEMNFRAVKNTFGPPHRDGKSVFYFRPSKLFPSVGFDVEADIQTLGLLTGIIERSGSYYSYADVKEQGRDKFFAKVKEGQLYEGLLGEIQEQLNSKFSTTFGEDEDRGSEFIDIIDPEV